MHEIVTLQFGQQANYLGTHFWNAQESYFTYDDPEKGNAAAAEPSPVDHDVHFRPGIGADGSDTFMPRAVIYDLKGAFGSLRKINALYEVEDDGNAALWPGATITHRAPAIPPSAYQQALDTGLQPPALTKETVRYWSDYSRVYYHPKGLVQLHEYELQSQLMPFEGWAVGDELFDGLDKEHDLPDRDLRPFIEECDQLQGLQVLSSVDDAWGGFSSRYVERLRDDFGKLPIWVWGLEEEEKKARDKLLRQLTNQSLSLHALAATASAYIPLAAGPKAPRPRYIDDDDHLFDPSSRWHTAALQAALLETATLPSRLRGARLTPLAQMEAVFDNGGNRRVVEARMSVGEAGGLKEALDERVRAKEEGGGEQAKKAKSVAHEDEGEEEGEQWDVDLSRLGPEEQIVQMMQRGRRGGGGAGRRGGGVGKKARLFGRAEALRGAWQGEGEVEALNQRARDRFAGAPMVQRYTSPLLFPAGLDSYPRIFAFEKHNANDNLAVRTALSTSSATSGRLRAMGMLVGRLVGVDMREELSNGLKSLADEYEEGWDSGLDGEDSEDDDE
ncbi:mtDNA inheritance, partitioning of the mitochondrial organelle [Diplodia intermedia]|uniref:MtDNA inheritance, partitioning of the mitochondrial organelle n=1 Tax=Diplodia intermedia TaxID=856260 RepID=A0ABR3T4H9_9PEZI